MSPTYIFRIDYMQETQGAAPATNGTGWIPSSTAGNNQLKGGGVSGKYWWCDGTQMRMLTSLPPGAVHFKTYSFYYDAGIWVSADDATRKDRDCNDWGRLGFEWDHDNEYSSYLSHAGERTTLNYQRPDQTWPTLLPNIYHAPEDRRGSGGPWGGLIGELPILLALIAFSASANEASPRNLYSVLSTCFHGGVFTQPSYLGGWIPQRGFVVRVWSSPAMGGQAASTTDDLEGFEEGHMGKYFT